MKTLCKVFLILSIIFAGLVTYIYAEDFSHYYKGVQLFNQKKYDEALNEFKLELNKEDKGQYCATLSYIGYIYFFQTKYDEGIKVCNDALKINPTYIFAIETLACIYMTGLKDYDKAMQYWYQAERLGSESNFLYYNIACYYSINNDSNNAFRYIDKTFFYGYRDIEWMKNDPDFNNIKSDKRFILLLENFSSILLGDDLCKKGDEFFKSNDYKNALEMYKYSAKEYEKVFIGDSTLIASIYDKIGTVYNITGDYNNAILYLDKSINIFSKFFGAMHKLTENVRTKCNNTRYHIGDRGDIKLLLNMQMGHSFYINSVSFSPDGKFILSGSGDNTIKLWDFASGKVIRTFVGHIHSVISIAFSPDGKFILSGSGDNTVKLWDIVSGKNILTFVGHSDPVNSVSFSSNGKYIISGSDDKKIKQWDAVTGKEIRTYIGHLDGVESVIFSHDDKYIISGSHDGTIKLWDSASGKEIRTFSGHSGSVNSVSFSPDGKYILSGSNDKTMKLWDVISGNVIKTFIGHYHSIESVIFSPDGRYAFSGSGITDNTIKVWDILTGKELRSFSGNRYAVKSIACSPDGKYLVSGGSDTSLKLYNIENGKELNIFHGYSSWIVSVAFSPNWKYIAVGLKEKFIKLYDITIGKEMMSFAGYSDGNCSVVFSPDGKYLLSGSNGVLNQEIPAKIWDVDNGKVIKTFGRNTDYITSLAYSPDGKYVLTGLINHTLVLWDISNSKIIRIFQGHSSSVGAVAFSGDGKYISSGSLDTTIKLWSLIKEKEVRTFIGHSDEVTSVVFSKDCKYLLSASNDKTIRLWDVETGKVIRTFIGHSSGILSAVFSPDGKLILSGSYDNTLKLWDALSGKEIRTYFGHIDTVTSVEFFQDGKFIISGSWDGTTRIWNIETGQWIAFMSHSNGKDWLIFDSDGYWDASRHGGDLVAMVKGMDCWNIDQFAVKNNRPDLILAKLPNADKNLISEYNKQYRKRIAKLEKLYGIKETDLLSDMHVPKVEILRTDRNGKNINLSIKLTDSQYDIVSYNVYVNDVPVYTEIGKKISRKKELAVTETIELSAGENKIEVSCFNEKGAESYRTLTYATCEEKRKGNLYFIGFGVSEYSDPSINDLKYAENDVLDLAKKFSDMKADYDNVYVKTYTGKEVTPGNIKAAKDFVKDAGVDDTVILFISGHGMHDSDEFRTYYYLTQKTDMKNLKGTAANFETVEDILAGINPRKKLFLMDTCDSGELDDFFGKKKVIVNAGKSKGTPRTPKGIVVEFNDNRGYFDRGRYIYNDLFRRTGAVVFSSSMGGEASWEFDSIKNGAFTEAILEGLSGKADADKNGKVTIDELNDYVGRAVIGFTDNRQHPVIDRDNIYVNIELPVR